MKKLYTLLVTLVITASTFAQAPEKMSYQAVVRDSGNAIVSNQDVGMQLSILQGTTAVYVETQTPTTNANGLVSIALGNGSVVSGTFATIDWSAGPYSIKTETDPTGPLTNYTITGTSELLSVPYALHATNGQGSGTSAGDMQYWNGSSWDVVAATPNEGATLQMIGGVPTWVGGTPPLPPATVGDLRDGGVVFWVDPADNTHGLVCAFLDSANSIEWGCYPTDLPSVPNVENIIPSGSGAEIGDGITNTNGILTLTDCPNSQAALAARSLGPEWFLPSINELNEMYLNRAILVAVPGFANFGNNVYWSSTEANGINTWYQYFFNGSRSKSRKDATWNVRGVRAF